MNCLKLPSPEKTRVNAENEHAGKFREESCKPVNTINRDASGQGVGALKRIGLLTAQIVEDLREK